MLEGALVFHGGLCDANRFCALLGDIRVGAQGRLHAHHAQQAERHHGQGHQSLHEGDPTFTLSLCDHLKSLQLPGARTKDPTLPRKRSSTARS